MAVVKERLDSRRGTREREEVNRKADRLSTFLFPPLSLLLIHRLAVDRMQYDHEAKGERERERERERGEKST